MGHAGKKIFSIFCMAGVIFFLSSCRGDGIKETVIKKGGGKEIIPLKVSRVITREVPLIVHAQAITVPFESVEIKQVGKARITEIPVEEGQAVGYGEVLVRYDDEELRLRLDLARAELRESETILEELSQKNQPKNDLLEDEKINNEEIDVTGIRTSRFEATQERAKAEIAWLERAAQDTTILSPITGIVAEKNFVAGSIPKEDDIIVKVVRIDPIKVQIDLPQNYLSSISTDTQVTVKFDAMPRQVFPVEISLIGPEVGDKSGTFRIRGKILNEERTLRPGLKGEATLKTNYRTTAFLVPDESIVNEEGKEYIYRIVDNAAKKVQIARGEPVEDMPNIIKGIKSDDFIAVSDLDRLYDGASVRMEFSR